MAVIPTAQVEARGGWREPQATIVLEKLTPATYEDIGILVKSHAKLIQLGVDGDVFDFLALLAASHDRWELQNVDCIQIQSARHGITFLRIINAGGGCSRSMLFDIFFFQLRMRKYPPSSSVGWIALVGLLVFLSACEWYDVEKWIGLVGGLGFLLL